MTPEEISAYFRINPCSAGSAYLLKQPDIETAWNNCTYPSWLWWALRYSHSSMTNLQVKNLYKFIRFRIISNPTLYIDELFDHKQDILKLDSNKIISLYGRSSAIRLINSILVDLNLLHHIKSTIEEQSVLSDYIKSNFTLKLKG